MALSDSSAPEPWCEEEGDSLGDLRSTAESLGPLVSTVSVLAISNQQWRGGVKARVLAGRTLDGELRGR